MKDNGHWKPLEGEALQAYLNGYTVYAAVRVIEGVGVEVWVRDDVRTEGDGSEQVD